MNSLYVLLAGINAYPPPVSTLRGCLKDLDQIEQLIERYYARHFQVHLVRLEDASATYRGIIDGFRTHLRKAGPDDVAWFHFSGHGSEEYTANEFWTLEPNGKDQTLVCHDSRAEGAEHLADKELAVLLNEVATLDVAGSAKGAPHIVVSLDCCHSGSGTRTAGKGETIIPRNTTSSGRKRQIDTYIDGYYKAQGKQLQIPTAPHVVLSACESVQQAGDLSSGGAFTSGLVAALESAAGELNYADLFLRTRSSVHKINPTQTPQFATLENFDPYTRFLDGTPLGTPDQYEVIRDKDTWYVKCGAIHGLPTNPPNPLELNIYSPPPENAHAGTAHILSVGAQRSVIDLSRNIDLKNFFGSLLSSDDKEYRATIKHLPAPPEFVHLEVSDASFEAFKSRWDPSKNIRIANDDDEPWLEVAERAGIFSVTDLVRNRKVFDTNSNTAKDVQAVLEALGKIVKWRRFVALENENPQSRMQNLVEFEVQVLDTQGGRTPFQAGEIKLYARPDNADNWKFGFFPIVRLRNIQQQLFFYLFYLNDRYSIECTDGEMVYRPEEHRDISHIELPLWKVIRGFGPEGEAGETTSYLKVLVTTEKLDHQQFQQSGLGDFRSALSSWNPGKISDDWGQMTMRVTIAKQNVSVQPDEAVEVAHGNIRISPHPVVRCGLSVCGIEASMRSVDPMHQFLQLQQEGLQLLRFPGAVDVLDVHGVDENVRSALEGAPLEITLREISQEVDVVPVAFDGRHFRVVGDSVSDGPDTSVSIQWLPVPEEPASDMAQTPFTSHPVHSSLVGAVKVAFFAVSPDAKAGFTQRTCLCCTE